MNGNDRRQSEHERETEGERESESEKSSVLIPLIRIHEVSPLT